MTITFEVDFDFPIDDGDRIRLVNRKIREATNGAGIWHEARVAVTSQHWRTPVSCPECGDIPNDDGTCDNGHVVHGMTATYDHGCRCEECQKAHIVANRPIA